MAALRGRFSEVTCPFFVLQGTEDKLCDPAGAQMFYDNASSVNKQLKVCTVTCNQFHNIRSSFTRGRYAWSAISLGCQRSRKPTKPFAVTDSDWCGATV